MTATELKDILVSPEFRQELRDISSYLASIVQERPIVFLIGKCLWKAKKYDFMLEDNHIDLSVDRKKIEFKFNYHTGMEKIKKELSNVGNNLDGIRGAFANIKHNFARMPRIYKDVCEKKPDIFVWIICERDFTDIPGPDAVRFPEGRALKKYERIHPYKSDQAFLSIAYGFLEILRAVRPFSVTPVEIETTGFFPSTYHFVICDFSTQV
jgi:hypothetical protein